MSTATKPAHTPTLSNLAGAVPDDNGRLRIEISMEDAKHYDRAVNSHDGLVAALKHARALIEARDVVLDRAALKMYAAALAKAKGGK